MLNSIKQVAEFLWGSMGSLLRFISASVVSVALLVLSGSSGLKSHESALFTYTSAGMLMLGGLLGVMCFLVAMLFPFYLLLSKNKTKRIIGVVLFAIGIIGILTIMFTKVMVTILLVLAGGFTLYLLLSKNKTKRIIGVVIISIGIIVTLFILFTEVMINIFTVIGYILGVLILVLMYLFINKLMDISQVPLFRIFGGFASLFGGSSINHDRNKDQENRWM